MMKATSTVCRALTYLSFTSIGYSSALPPSLTHDGRAPEHELRLPVLQTREDLTLRVFAFPGQLADGVSPVRPQELSLSERLAAHWLVPNLLEEVEFYAPLNDGRGVLLRHQPEEECISMSGIDFNGCRNNLYLHVDVQRRPGFPPIEALDGAGVRDTRIMPQGLTVAQMIQGQMDTPNDPQDRGSFLLVDETEMSMIALNWYIGVLDDPCQAQRNPNRVFTQQGPMPRGFDFHADPLAVQGMCTAGACGLMRFFTGS